MESLAFVVFLGDQVIALFFTIPGQMTDEVHRPAMESGRIGGRLMSLDRDGVGDLNVDLVKFK